jgi:hypothetical protein
MSGMRRQETTATLQSIYLSYHKEELAPPWSQVRGGSCDDFVQQGSSGAALC